MIRRVKRKRAAITDTELRATLVAAMAEAGADPTLVYVFHKTGVYVCAENEPQLTPVERADFEAAVAEYLALSSRIH